jgi:chromate transporter
LVNAWTVAVLASLLITWVTFVPSILFVLLGVPYMERLRGNRPLRPPRPASPPPSSA